MIAADERKGLSKLSLSDIPGKISAFFGGGGEGAAAAATNKPRPPHRHYAGTLPISDWLAAEPVRAELDSDGFVVSFSLPEEKEAAVAHFRKYGFVVARDVLTEEETQATWDEFWDSKRARVDVSNPDTWEDFFATQQFGHLGIMGGLSELHSATQLNNRQNPKVFAAYCAILDTDKTYSDHDRLGMMRPTVNVTVNGETRDRPEWRTRANWLHLDCNPVRHHASIGGFSDNHEEIDFASTIIIQSLITLTDARVEDGGFHCVPGAHLISAEWAADHLSGNSASNMQVSNPSHCDTCALLHARIQQIPIRRGSLLMWTSLLFHGNHPNHSERWRACQYIRHMPIKGTPYSPLTTDRSHYAEGWEPSELGKKLFGFEPWEED